MIIFRLYNNLLPLRIMTIDHPGNTDNSFNTNPAGNTFGKKELFESLLKEPTIHLPKDDDQFKESLEDIDDDTLMYKLNEITETAKRNIENILLIYEEFSKRGHDHSAVRVKRISTLIKGKTSTQEKLNELDKKFIDLIKKIPGSE